MDSMAPMRREGVDRWWMTAMLIAKSKVRKGWGRVRMSAIRAVWGWWRVAIVAREGDLRGKKKI